MNNDSDIRQGDVLLKQAAAVPPDAILVPDDRGRVVLAYGEVTGHAHAIADHIRSAVGAERNGVVAREALLPEASGDYIRAKMEADQAIQYAMARLYESPTRGRFLSVTEGSIQCEELTGLSLIEDTITGWLIDSRYGEVWFNKRLFTFDGLELSGPDFLLLKHEEHKPHAVPPGIYRLPVQVEYSPAQLRQVAD